MCSRKVREEKKGSYRVLEREISIENRFSAAIFVSTYYGYFVKLYMFYKGYLNINYIDKCI